jgi:alanine dehydrogenase
MMIWNEFRWFHRLTLCLCGPQNLPMQTLRYLSSSDIERLAISTAAVVDAVESVFRQKSLGRAQLRPKISLNPAPGATAEALLGVDLDAQTAVVKYVSVSPDNASLGIANVQATIVLSETVRGQVRSVMNGTWITGVRTAACSAVGAKYLAAKKPAGMSVGFIGAGLQARTNLDALLHVCPGITRVTVHSRTRRSAEDFMTVAKSRGLDASHASEVREAVEGQDIVVSSVPPSAGLVPFIDPAWVAPGCYVAAVDLGRSWLPAQWGATFDVIATDDREQSELRGRGGKMIVPGRFDAELGDLVLGSHAGRTSAAQRTALLFAGTALADLAVATLVDREARRQTVGTELPV